MDLSGVVSVAATNFQERVVVAYGLADRSNAIPVTADTRFGIASGTKFLTALATGILIGSGDLAYDTRVKDVVSFDRPPPVPHLWDLYFDYYDGELVADFDNYLVDMPWSFLTTPRD